MEIARGRIELPTNPERFRAALFLQTVNGELWIPLCFQRPFDPARFSERREVFTRNNFELVAETFRCVRMSADVLSKSRLQIDSRANVMPPG